jgi:hypothetical protein
MARIYHVKKSQKERYCTPGGHTIPVGSAVASAAPGFHSKEIFACSAHPFRASHLTTSLRSEPLAAQEAFDDALDQLEAEVESFKEVVEAYVDSRNEALEAWENGNSPLEELAEIAQTALDAFDDYDFSERWDGDDADLEFEEPEPQEPHGEPDHNGANYRAYEEALEEWEAANQAQQEAVQSKADFVEQQFEAASELSSGLEF